MKRFYKTATIAVAISVMLASCGNAGAKTDKTSDNTVTTEKTQKTVQELNATTFNSKVYDMAKEELKYLGNKPAIVDFTASWCGPCQRISPILEELAQEYGDKIDIYKVDIDKNRDLALSFNVSSIPAILYIPLEGEPVMTVGARDKGKFKTEIDTMLLGK